MTSSARQEWAEETYACLFGPRDRDAPETHPELMAILRGVVFGDVFRTGELDDATRELVTVTVLSVLGTGRQLGAHTHAALNVGVPPVSLREAVYQLAPFVGFPRTLTALVTVDDVLTARGVELPLPDQGTVGEDERYERGLEIQAPLYGTEIRDNLADLPAPFDEALPRFLTEWCFGDFYTREGLTLAQRELLVLCALTALGDTGPQLTPHARACLEVGNSRETVLAAIVHCLPYVGFPRTLAAVRAVKGL
ncbi:carboxymuconolactone decarboxylase family protein [Aquipuribacter nitratireducens]|uniref:Carboxymuconolactone decarboxylase family protein n=1 Tax=Aquipuribacter nitratireducens TaxID=650104 RepID=A0ABW0GPS8_9MICO